jgi:hypothetical protein
MKNLVGLSFALALTVNKTFCGLFSLDPQAYIYPNLLILLAVTGVEMNFLGVILLPKYPHFALIYQGLTRLISGGPLLISIFSHLGIDIIA